MTQDDQIQLQNILSQVGRRNGQNNESVELKFSKEKRSAPSLLEIEDIDDQGREIKSET